MSSPYRYFRGYPAAYRGFVVSRIGCSLGCLPFVLIPLYTAAFYWNSLRGNLRPGPTIGLLLSALLFIAFASVAFHRMPAPRILPFFEKHLGDTDTWLSGEALARNCRALDEAAEAHGIVPLSAYGYREAPPGQDSDWHDAFRGEETMKRLAALVRRFPALVDDPVGVRRELEIVEDALAKASYRGVRFCLHMRCSDFVCPAEMAAKKGSYF